MKATRKQATAGFKNLEDLRRLILILGELREAASLGLPLPSSDASDVQARPKGAETGAP